MKIRSQEFRDKVAGEDDPVSFIADSDHSWAHMSSNGEMKISLNEMICETPTISFHIPYSPSTSPSTTHVLVPQMLQELQFSVCPFAQNGSREGLHDFLDGDRGTA